MHQGLANAVTTTTGRRSGSGKIVMEPYEELVKLWGGNSASKSLTFEVSSSSITNNIPNSNASPTNSYASSTSCSSSKSFPSRASENEAQHDSSSGYVPWILMQKVRNF